MEAIYKNKKCISILLITAILYARCVLGIAINRPVAYVNYLVDALAFLFCLLLFFKDRQTTIKSFFNLATLWIVLFAAVEYVYGHYQLRDSANYFSREYLILTLGPAILIMVILYNNADEIMDLLTIPAAIFIPAIMATSFFYDPVWKQLLEGNDYRVGATPAGTCTDTGNIILILLVPVFYRIIINREFKAYLWVAILGLVGIFLGGSKSSVFPIVFVFAIMLVGSAKNRKDLHRNILILFVLAILGTSAVMFIPKLYGIIGERIVELFVGMSSTEYDLHTSTGQRMAVMAAFKEHFGETPIFGHGFYAFKEMPYSQLEEYHVNGETLYRHIQTHSNFLELLFSFGIFGFVVYYWFPAKLLIDAIRSKDKRARIIVLSLLVSLLFIDMGLDMFYKYLTSFFAYIVAYIFLKSSSISSADSKEV